MTKPLPRKAKRKRRPRGSLHINDILNAAERVIRRTGRTDFTLTAVQVESRYGVGSFYEVLSGDTKAARRDDILRRLIQRRAITMQEHVDQQLTCP